MSLVNKLANKLRDVGTVRIPTPSRDTLIWINERLSSELGDSSLPLVFNVDKKTTSVSTQEYMETQRQLVRMANCQYSFDHF